ncbi:hypothetical protein F66182_2471 [Fusarium sp. NRRL 66182]|nr:hypothetical protein F66182_2471 [Fusarium sp. NRRL 66182]
MLLPSLVQLFWLLPVVEARSTLFTDGTIITFDEQAKETIVRHNTSVLVVDDTITAITTNAQPDDIPADVEIISAEGMILSPGFIDTHRHTWQTTHRTIASNTTLAEYFVRYSPFSDVLSLFSPEDFYLSQMVGLFEALNAGVTSLLDHAHNIAAEDDATVALDAYLESSARVFFGYNFDLRGNFSIQSRAAHFKKLQEDARLPGSAVTMGLSCDSWHTFNETDLQSVLDLLRNDNISVLTSHSSDGIWNAAHRPSYFEDLGLLNDSYPIVLSHATFMQQPEYEILKRYNHFISITPESEMHFGHTNDESEFFMDQASLGVDTHATFSGDIITQARLWLQSVRLRSFKRTLDEMTVPQTNPMSVNQAFYLATRAGARALRRDDLGIIAVGSKADIVAFNGTSPNMVGWRDPVAAVILHSNVGDVRHVMVNGELVKRDGSLTAANVTGVMEAFAHSAQRIQEQAVRMPFTTNGGFIFNPSAVAGYPDNVDALRGDGTGY